MAKEIPALFALFAALVLGGARAAAAAPGATAKPPQCAMVPDAKFQAAAIEMLKLCPESKESSCPDDCVSALIALQYDCSMALAVARANAELQDVEAAVDAIQAVWESCLTSQGPMLTKRVDSRLLAESPDGAPTGDITAIRLVNGNSAASGRLEVQIGGQWGTVCGDSFYDNDAQVACRQLGYSSGRATTKGYFGGNSDIPIYLDEVDCYGGESSLNDCGFARTHDCQHSEDVGVFCDNGSIPVATPSTPTPTTPTPSTPTPTTSTPTPVPRPPPPSYTSSGSSGGSSVPIGAIVGGVVGGILAIAAVAGGVYYAQRQRALRMARSPADKWLDGPGAGQYSPPPPTDPEAPTGGALVGGSGGAAASAGGAGGSAAVAGAAIGAAAALAAAPAAAAAVTSPKQEQQPVQAATIPSTLPSSVTKEAPRSHLQDTFISATPASSAPKGAARSDLQDTFISPPRPAAPQKEASSGGAQDTLIPRVPTPDGGEPPIASEEALSQKDVPATQEALAGAPDAVAPQDVVATASTSTATLPQTPNGPQTRSLVQSIASRSSHSSAMNSKLMSQDVLLSYIAKQRSLPAVAREDALQPRGSSGVNVAPWEVNFDELVMIEPIGEGSFGRVYMADFHATTVAVKVLIDKEAMANAGPKEALSLPGNLMSKLDEEASLLASLRHPCVVQFMGVCRTPPCIITEYCPKGNLTAVLMAAKRDAALNAELTWRRRLSMALDASRGMVYLHTRSPPIIHRDLKSPNLLVDDSYHCKVSDFNLSRFVEENLGTRSSSMAAMNPRWLAPEVMKGDRATPAADVYSFGIVLWELLTWELPWSTTGPWQLVNLLMNGGHLEIPPREELPGADTPSFDGLDAYIQLMKRCWAQNQFDRPGFEEVTRELRTLLDSTA